jgi:hypothetical protein
MGDAVKGLVSAVAYIHMFDRQRTDDQVREAMRSAVAP